MPITGTPITSAARAGMATLITRWRRMVDDASSAVWDDLEAEELLDQFRADHYELPLVAMPRRVGGELVTTVYSTDGIGNLEESASGATAWRLFDTDGDDVTADNVDYLLGSVRFDADQNNAVYLLDCRSFDLAGAAAQGWRERMASKASSYDFEADGARYTRSQWFAHCAAMAAHYEAQRPAKVGSLVRSDAW